MENTRTTTTTTAGNMSRHEGTNESHDGLNHLQARLSGSKAYATNNTCNSSSNSSASAASSSAPPSPTVSTKLLQVVSTSGHNNNNSKEESSNTNNNAKSNTNFGDQKWHEMYQRLVKYKQKHGDCRVPNRHDPDQALGYWVSTQRRQHRIMVSQNQQDQEEGPSSSYSMTRERAALLEKIGFVWSAKDPSCKPWAGRYADLCAFVRKYGHAGVPMDYKEDPRLPPWVSAQRHEFKLLSEGKVSRLTQDRVNKLNAVGFLWKVPRGRKKRKAGASDASAADSIQEDTRIIASNPASEHKKLKPSPIPSSSEPSLETVATSHYLQMVAANSAAGAGANTAAPAAAPAAANTSGIPSFQDLLGNNPTGSGGAAVPTMDQAALLRGILLGWNAAAAGTAAPTLAPTTNRVEAAPPGLSLSQLTDLIRNHHQQQQQQQAPSNPPPVAAPAPVPAATTANDHQDSSATKRQIFQQLMIRQLIDACTQQPTNSSRNATTAAAAASIQQPRQLAEALIQQSKAPSLCASSTSSASSSFLSSTPTSSTNYIHQQTAAAAPSAPAASNLYHIANRALAASSAFTSAPVANSQQQQQLQQLQLQLQQQFQVQSNVLSVTSHQHPQAGTNSSSHHQNQFHSAQSSSSGLNLDMAAKLLLQQFGF